MQHLEMRRSYGWKGPIRTQNLERTNQKAEIIAKYAFETGRLCEKGRGRGRWREGGKGEEEEEE